MWKRTRKNTSEERYFNKILKDGMCVGIFVNVCRHG